MKAIITFTSRLEFDIDDKMKDKMVPKDEQVKQMKRLLMEECDCERVEISEYCIEFRNC